MSKRSNRDRATVLIVDDENLVTAAMRDLLELKGYAVLEADSGPKGLELCVHQPVDLIILDLSMPRMDGYTFMERLHDRWKNGGDFVMPKILALTSVDRDTDFVTTTRLGATRFMSKPFKSSELIAAVQDIIDPR